MNLDLYLFSFINGFAKKSKAMDFFAIFCSTYSGPLLFLTLALVALITGNFEILIFPFFSAVVARLIISESIYFFYKRKRPTEVFSVNQLIKKPNHPSFPSGHASAFFALSFGLLPYSLTLTVIFLSITCLMAFSRVFSGVHWPSDILAGIICGLASFIVVFFIKNIL